jgi:hypothetical protein
MDTHGINWNVEQAIISDCGSFQNEETGEPMAWAKMEYFGGKVSLNITPDDLLKVAPYKGKMVKATGKLSYEIKKNTGKETIRFSIDEIKPLAGSGK